MIVDDRIDFFISGVLPDLEMTLVTRATEGGRTGRIQENTDEAVTDTPLIVAKENADPGGRMILIGMVLTASLQPTFVINFI